MSFEKEFVWGASSSSYQIEGAVNTDGKGPSDWDVFTKRDGAVVGKDNGDVACDHYHRYVEDVQLMKEIGLQAYRFSICWPRVLPEGIGRVNPKGLDFYSQLVDELLAANIDPWITLFHWDYPYALEQQGGWQNPDSPKWFADYTSVMVDALSDRVSKWITLNETQVFFGFGYNQTVFPPALGLPWKQALPAMHNVLLAHGLSTQVIRSKAKTKPTIGVAPAVTRGCIPYGDSPEEKEFARKWNFSEQKKDFFGTSIWSDPVFLGEYPKEMRADMEEAVPGYKKDMKIISEPLDFFAYNFYNAEKVHTEKDGSFSVGDYGTGWPRTQMEWPVTPEGLSYFSQIFYDRYKKPIVITESGMACHDWVSEDGKVHDPQRIDYISQYLKAYQKANNAGVDMLGYFTWSIMDNFEWTFGYAKRFGMIHVDFETQKRTLKDSAYFYRDVIRSNGELCCS